VRSLNKIAINNAKNDAKLTSSMPDLALSWRC
jgi:hypothetical protein